MPLPFNHFEGNKPAQEWVREKLDPFVSEHILTLSQPHVLLNYCRDGQRILIARRISMAIDAHDNRFTYPALFEDNTPIVVHAMRDSELAFLETIRTILTNQFNEKPISPLFIGYTKKDGPDRDTTLIASLFLQASKNYPWK